MPLWDEFDQKKDYGDRLATVIYVNKRILFVLQISQ